MGFILVELAFSWIGIYRDEYRFISSAWYQFGLSGCDFLDFKDISFEPIAFRVIAAIDDRERFSVDSKIGGVGKRGMSVRRNRFTFVHGRTQDQQVLAPRCIEVFNNLFAHGI